MRSPHPPTTPPPPSRRPLCPHTLAPCSNHTRSMAMSTNPPNTLCLQDPRPSPATRPQEHPQDCRPRHQRRGKDRPTGRLRPSVVSEPNHPPVKIPPRRSRALELVPDPADAPEPSPASENKSADTDQPTPPKVSIIAAPVSDSHRELDKGPLPSEPQALLQAQPEAQPEPVTETSNESSNLAPVTAPAQSQPIPTETHTDDNKEKTQPSTPTDVTPVMKPSTPAEIEIMTSDVSSTTLIDAQQEEKDLPLPPVEPSSVSALPESATKTPEEPVPPTPVVPDDAPAADEPSPCTEPSAEVLKSEPESESPTSPLEAKQEREEKPTAEEASPAPEQTKGDDAEEESVDEDKSPSDSASHGSSPPRRTRSGFLSDGRLIYPPSFMWAVRPTIPARKVTEYDAGLRGGGRDIFKGESTGGRSDPRSQSGRNRAPLSSDPRGSRTYPSSGSAPFSMPMGGPHGSGPGGRSFPDFDLSLARSQAPPPPRGGQASAREGDPRGSRQQQGRGRYDQSRHSGSDPFIHRAPVEKLKRTENGWKRNKEADDDITAKVKQIRSLLNKLTLEKFDKIFKQIVDIDISSSALLDRIVKEIFEKTLFEPEFSGMYAELCRRLEAELSVPSKRANVTDSEGKPIPFKRILLNNCRDEFTRFAESAESKDDEKKGEEESGESEENKPKKEMTKEEKEEAELKATNAKRRMLANVRFIGELYLKDLLKEHIIHRNCIQRLLKLGIESKEEDVLEALCKLVSKTGAKISTNPEAEKLIREYFSRFELLSRDHTLPARIRFMIQDLIEQRRNGWKVRREKKGAKTIAEIHKEAKEEERRKMEAQQAARDRRHRGGMGGRDRIPQGFVPRMTMPSGPRQGGNQSRLDRTLEKQPNRPISSISGGFPPVSLRPGTSSARVGSLRPGGSSFGSFGVLSSDKDTSANGQTTETRRSKMGGWQPVSRRSQSSAPKSAPPKPDVMDPKILKRKAKGAMEEYWANPSLTEVREILAEEIKAPNYKSFIHEALVATFSAKVAHQIKGIDLFVGLVEAPIPGQVFSECFSKLVGKLSDMEIDNPRTGEFLGRRVGFLARDMQAIEDPKRRANLAIFTFAELYQRLNASVPDDDERANIVRQVADRIHVDFAGDMSAWNPMRGLDKLSDMLKDNKVSFLVPYLETETRLKELISEKESTEKVEKLLRSASEVANSNLMRMVVRCGFDTFFMSSTDEVVEQFKKCIGTPVVSGFGSLSPDVQFSVLLATQVFIGRSLNFLPPLSNTDEKHGDVAFKALFESGLVASGTFTRWLRDKTESEKVACKKEMIEQSHRFFKLLPKAK
ncbi:Translation initiation factor eIF4 subunit G [Gracilaria domingensis]|nr:Translation initiation factor eIF4 subunit G [Gracilaria domingensis]